MSGWYPDPTGRFEYRYHNDEEWTADVRVRRPAVRRSRSAGADVGPVARGNGLAVAGMVCGIVGRGVAWVPFVAVLGLITAIVGWRCRSPGWRGPGRPAAGGGSPSPGS